MADDPRTLFERLNDLLEDLGLKLSRESNSPNQPTSEPSIEGPDKGRPFSDSWAWTWLEDLLKRLFGDLGTKVLDKISPRSSQSPVNRVRNKSGQWISTKQQSGIPKTSPVPIQPSTAPYAPTASAGEYDSSKSIAELGKVFKSLGYAPLPTNPLQQIDRNPFVPKPERSVEDVLTKLLGKLASGISSGTKIATEIPARLSRAASQTSSDDLGGAAQTVIGGVQSGLSMMGPEGMAAAQVLELAKASAGAVGHLRDLSREMINASFRFGEFSAEMSSVAAEQEVRDVELGMQKGEDRAESTAKLAEAMSELNETMMPLETAFVNFSNEVLTHLVKAVNQWVKIDVQMNLIRSMLEVLTGPVSDKDDDKPGRDFTQFLIDEGKKYGRPKRIPEA